MKRDTFETRFWNSLGIATLCIAGCSATLEEDKLIRTCFDSAEQVVRIFLNKVKSKTKSWKKEMGASLFESCHHKFTELQGSSSSASSPASLTTLQSLFRLKSPSVPHAAIMLSLFHSEFPSWTKFVSSLLATAFGRLRFAGPNAGIATSLQEHRCFEWLKRSDLDAGHQQLKKQIAQLEDALRC